MVKLTTILGLQIAAIVGGILQAIENEMVVLIDGFIAASALLVAHTLNQGILSNCIFCHQTGEAGNKLMLDSIHIKPLLQIESRLGEGPGFALAYPIIQPAVGMLNEMASMDSL